MTNAADVWASMLGQGVHFLMPPKAAALPRLGDRAAALADAERERLATGDLFYFDAAACDAAGCVEQRHQGVEHLVPSAAGFLVWEKPPMYLRGGVPIRAVSWGVAYDGGTWVAWWSDTLAAVQLRQLPPAVLTVNGLLMYHKETHFHPQSWPAQLGDSDHPEYGMLRGLLGAWTVIDTGAVEEKLLPPLCRVRKVARWQLQVEAPPVRSFTRSHR
ncbi:hypothetical protein [Streptomyces sp. NPDC101455]|uniref:hypothetical protein n=1 Tax=Streptomyces sp. NPDC101455 TaxID=3366142 RepID=UPI003812DD9B